MSQITGPKFNCPSCGKEYKWKPELAGKKGKCKCGSVMLVPAKAPKVKVPEPELAEDTYDVADSSGAAEEDAPLAPPPYAGAAVAAPPPYTPAAAVAGKAAVATADDSGARELKWAPALKWFGIGALLAVWSVWELSSPTDPEEVTHRRGIRMLVAFVNMIFGPKGGVFMLGGGALAFFVIGFLILIGKAKDSDYEHAKEQDKWPSSRGRR
jgi:hypothetical protein